jgi:hypothetical protein
MAAWARRGACRCLEMSAALLPVERITGQATAAAVPVEVNLIMDSTTLLDADDHPAHLTGYGPIPADLARRLAVSPRWKRPGCGGCTRPRTPAG